MKMGGGGRMGGKSKTPAPAPPDEDAVSDLGPQVQHFPKVVVETL